MLNEVGSLAQPIVLVLDDYQLITAPPADQGIAFLLDPLPPQLHLVIAPRVDPPLPLSRMRGRAELTELRAADLRFTADESAAFLNEVMGVHLAAQDVAALEARTEGWITGLEAQPAAGADGCDPELRVLQVPDGTGALALALADVSADARRWIVLELC